MTTNDVSRSEPDLEHDAMPGDSVTTNDMARSEPDLERDAVPRDPTEAAGRVGIVVIGRNEALRLRRVLEAASAVGAAIVYVDSASSDDSVSIAESVGVDTVVLDDSIPMSAARARNVGAEHLAASWRSPELLLFIDGDCVLQPGFAELAVEALDADDSLGAVCGWRRESQPHRNVFHEIVDMEWKMGDVGIVDDFAGDVMMKRVAFLAAGRYDAAVMAAEDTEFSSRMRAAGYAIRRIDTISTLHDINMTSVRQWWRRNVRAGLGYGMVAEEHRSTDQLFLGQVKRVALWGFAVPALAVVALPKTRIPAVLFATRIAVSSLRAARSVSAERAPLRQRLLWGVSCTTSAVPAAVGLGQYVRKRLRSEAPTLVEYKHADD